MFAPVRPKSSETLDAPEQATTMSPDNPHFRRDDAATFVASGEVLDFRRREGDELNNH